VRQVERHAVTWFCLNRKSRRKRSPDLHLQSFNSLPISHRVHETIPMSTAINIPIATDLLRRCTSCKVALPSSCIWKTCDKCREKSRVKQRNKTEQNKQRVAMLLLNGQTQISNMDVLNLKRKQAVDDETRKLKKLKVALAQVGPATAPSPVRIAR